MVQHSSEWNLGPLAWPLCSHPESSCCSRTGPVIPRGVWLVALASAISPQKARRISFHLPHEDSSGTSGYVFCGLSLLYKALLPHTIFSSALVPLCLLSFLLYFFSPPFLLPSLPFLPYFFPSSLFREVETWGRNWIPFVSGLIEESEVLQIPQNGGLRTSSQKPSYGGLLDALLEALS